MSNNNNNPMVNHAIGIYTNSDNKYLEHDSVLVVMETEIMRLILRVAIFTPLGKI